MKRWWALLAVVLVATAAAYAPAIDGEFVFDDVETIADPLVADPLGASALAWVRPGGRPVTAITFALNRLAVGLDTRGWHLTNVAIHLGAVVLAFLFARVTLSRAGLLRPEGPALAAAALFALHPLQTESVAYLTQRAESLASAIYLGAFLLLLARDHATGLVRRGALLAAATALHAVGLGAKVIVATLPVAWLLHAAAFPAPGEEGVPAWRRAWRRFPSALPAFALSAVTAVLAIRSTVGIPHAGYDIPGMSVVKYVATELRVVPTYLRLLVWPSGQCADWQFRTSRDLMEPTVVAGAAALAAVIVAAIAAVRRFRGHVGDGPAAARASAFGVLFFLLALTPSSSVVPLRDPLAEHRVYLAALGVFIAGSAVGAFAVRRLAGARAAVVGAAVVTVILPAAAIATARRSLVWTTPLALWSDAAEKAPEKARVQMALGHAYQAEGDPEPALRRYLRARELHSDGTAPEEEILGNIVSALLALDRFDEARAETEHALAQHPRHPGLFAMLAQVELGANHDAESERAARAALAIEPTHPEALKYLGLARMRRGDIAGAREALRALAATGYVDPLVYWALGEVEVSAGNPGAACSAYAIAVGQPGNAWASGRAARAQAGLRCR